MNADDDGMALRPAIEGAISCIAQQTYRIRKSGTI
jgi:hypothetical protein